MLLINFCHTDVNTFVHMLYFQNFEVYLISSYHQFDSKRQIQYHYFSSKVIAAACFNFTRLLGFKSTNMMTSLMILSWSIFFKVMFKSKRFWSLTETIYPCSNQSCCWFLWFTKNSAIIHFCFLNVFGLFFGIVDSLVKECSLDI